MTRYVVDASVAAKWSLPEIHSADALRLIDESHDLLAPDVFVSEMANVLTKLVWRGLLAPDEARRRFGASMLKVELRPTLPLADVALDLAFRHRCTPYDAMYVALGIVEQCSMVTADRKLYESLVAAYRETMVWVGDLPASPGA